MGLLDDAIREHLDLKRARGADPAEVERLEREALGPVRRDPTIGASHYDAPERHEHLRHPEDLGYHDSTAPHSESHLEQHAPRLDLAGGHAQTNGVHTEEEEEQPKRRFLRRSRPASQTGPIPDPEALAAYEHHDLPDHLDLPHYDDLLDHDDALEHHELLEHDDVIAHDEPPPLDQSLEHDEPLEHDQPLEHDEPLDHEPATELHQVAEPPQIRFDAPPTRPRFTTEPPRTADPETAAPTEPESAASAEPQPGHHDEPATRHHEPQPTHEFDVPSTFRKRSAEPEQDAEQGEEDDKDEDVLEETPEFLQDTPEHDRLWFEQRPPRDFDFDG